jgi:hypothetical protein
LAANRRRCSFEKTKRSGFNQITFRNHTGSAREIQRGEGTLFIGLYGNRGPENVFSHTSPVYATVNGQPIRSWDDAQYYVGYRQHAIDWLKTEARFASGEDRKSSIAAFEQARAVYEQPGARREANSAAVGGFEIVRGGPLGAIR